MTSDQIVKAVSTLGMSIETFCGPNASPEFANLRATLEVAYQLARLNEGFESLTSQRGNQQLRVQVEPGDYPIAVTQL
jgi:hypothetical protein